MLLLHNHILKSLDEDVRLNSTHIFIIKIPKKRELRQTALNYSFDIEFKGFMKIYKMYCRTILLLVNDTTLPLVNPLTFRKNLFR